MRGVMATAGLVLVLAAAPATVWASGEGGADAAMAALADRAVALALEQSPPAAYAWGLPTEDHTRWPDRSAEATARFHAAEDALFAALRGIDAGELTTASARLDHALLTERLEAAAQARVCRRELWDVSHMGGWHLALPRVADRQPVDTADQRAQALARWADMPAYVDREIENLRRGLAQGFSSPASVVRRTIVQFEGLASADAATSALSSPARRSDDPAFAAAFRAVIAETVNPALARYQAFLETEYLPRARTELGVSAHPDGVACYDALLRTYTTLDRNGQAVHDVGAAAVAANLADIYDIGERRFGTRDLNSILTQVRTAPDNQFDSEAELIAYSRQVVDRARVAVEPLFAALPDQVVLSEPFPDYQRGSGASAHYVGDPDPTRPAYYRIDSENWASETRGGAEITAAHEAYPGHHTQIAIAYALDPSPLARISGNSAFVEGWGRYSERLAEEAGVYSSDYALIQRRVWPARGMVADPGLHVLGWSREQVEAYLGATQRFGPDEVAAMADRMALLPGQLTAYDSGGLEIAALRREAEAALGERFDIRRFHQTVLERGSVPLQDLRRHVEAWIAAGG